MAAPEPMSGTNGIFLHGVFMEIHGLGVLLSGAAGIGKSTLALELLHRAHRLVADDAPLFCSDIPGKVHGICPEPLQDFLAVRGLGVLNVRKLFGDSAICPGIDLDLIIDLTAAATPDSATIQGPRQVQRRVLEVTIAQVRLTLAPGENRAILVECLVRNQQLMRAGYDSALDFSTRQEQRMRGSAV